MHKLSSFFCELSLKVIWLNFSKMSSLVEIRNVEEIYIHYFVDKCRDMTDARGVQVGECKPCVFSLTQIEAANSCQEKEQFVRSQKCDQLKGLQDFPQNGKTGFAHTARVATSPKSISGSDMELMEKTIDNSKAPSHGECKSKSADGGGNKIECEQKDNGTGPVNFDNEKIGNNLLKKVDNLKTRREKENRKERLAASKVAEKSSVGSEDLTLELESLLDIEPTRQVDATTQVKKGSIRRLLGRNNKINREYSSPK